MPPAMQPCTKRWRPVWRAIFRETAGFGMASCPPLETGVADETMRLVCGRPRARDLACLLVGIQLCLFVAKAREKEGAANRGTDKNKIQGKMYEKAW